MANTMQVELVSPERVLFTGEATMVVTRTLDGDIAFQPGHAPFLGALRECHSRIYLADGSVQHVAVHGGFVQVDGQKVSILSDAAELSEDIDLDRARQAKARSEERMRHDHDTEAEAAMRRAEARISAAGR